MKILLALILAAGCSVGPDALNLNYQHEFAGDGSIEGWPMLNDDSDYVGIGFTWDLKPRQVQVIQMAPPPQDPEPVEPDPPPPAAADLEAGDIIDAFTTTDVVTRIALLITVLLLAWMSRDRWIRLIPGGNGKK